MMAKQWETVRSVIIHLYINEGRTLKDVKAIMETQYGFTAAIRSYRQRFVVWDVKKYYCKKREEGRRHKKALTRNLLPTPPTTPPVQLAPATIVMTPQQFVASPELMHTDNESSSNRSSQGVPSPLVDTSLRERQYPPAPQQFPAYFEAQPVVEARMRNPWGESDLHAILRNPSMQDNMLPNLTAGLPRMPDKASSSTYPSMANTYNNLEWGRGTQYQLSNTESEYYRVSYQETIPRVMPDQFRSPPALYPRLYQQPHSPPMSAPKLLTDRSVRLQHTRTESNSEEEVEEEET